MEHDRAPAPSTSPALRRRDFIAGAAGSFAMLHGGRVSAARPPSVVVVGAGIIGASIAYHLARRGAVVTVIEKEKPGSGATHGSFAWLTAYDKNPRAYYDLHLAGIMGWQRLQREIGRGLPIQWGGTVQWAVTEDGAAALRSKVAEREREGYPMHLVDAEELHKLLPGRATGAVTAAAFADIGGGLDPLQATAKLLAQAQRMGARLIHPCEVLSLRTKGDSIAEIVTSQGTLVADHYVLATGVGTAELARQAGVDAPLIQARGLLAHTKPFRRVLDHVIILPEGGVGIKQNPDGRIVTSTHFDGYDKLEVTDALGRRMLAEAARHVPALGQAKFDFLSVGFVAMRKGGLPIAGAVRGKSNLFIAALNNGITLAPVIGQLASIEVLDGVNTTILDDYRV